MWYIGQITLNDQSNTKYLVEKYDFFNQIVQVPWWFLNQIDQVLWNSLELFQSAMEFYIKKLNKFQAIPRYVYLDNISWNSMTL